MNPVQFQAQQPQAIHAQVIYPPQQNYSFFTQVLPQLFQMAGAAKQLIEGNPLQDAQVNTERTRNQDYYNRYINESNDPAQRKNRWEQSMAGAQANGDETAIAQLKAMDPSLMDLDQQGRQQQFRATSELSQMSEGGMPSGPVNNGGNTGGGGLGESTPQTTEAVSVGQPGGETGQAPMDSPSGQEQMAPPSGGQGVPPSQRTGPPPITSEIQGNPNLPQAPATDPLLHEVSRKTGLPVEYLYKSDHPDTKGYPLVKPEIGAALNAPLAAMVPPPPPGPEDPVIKQAVASVQPTAQQWVRTFGRSNLWNKFVTKQALDDADLFSLQVGGAQADMFLREAAAKAGYMDQKDFDPQMMLYLAEGLKSGGTRGPGFVDSISYLNTIPPTARKFIVEMAGNLAQYDLNYAKLAEERAYHGGLVTNAAEANELRRQEAEAKKIVDERRFGPQGLEERTLQDRQRQTDAYTRNVNLKTNRYTVTINGKQYEGTKDELDLAMKAITTTASSQASQQRQQEAVVGMLKTMAGVRNTDVIAASGQMTAIKFEMKEYADQRQQTISLLNQRQRDLDAAKSKNMLFKSKTETDAQFEQRVAAHPNIRAINDQISEYRSKVAAYDEILGASPVRDAKGTMSGGTGLRQELWQIQNKMDTAAGSSGQMGSILAQATDEYIQTGQVGPKTLQLLQATLPAGGQSSTGQLPQGIAAPAQSSQGIMTTQQFWEANKARYPNYTPDDWKRAYAQYKKSKGVK